MLFFLSLTPVQSSPANSWTKTKNFTVKQFCSFYYSWVSCVHTYSFITNALAISKKLALFWDILSTQKAKFQIWYLSEFLVVLWPKYVVINKTTLGIHKNGQIKIFVKIPIGLCAQI